MCFETTTRYNRLHRKEDHGGFCDVNGARERKTSPPCVGLNACRREGRPSGKEEETDSEIPFFVGISAFPKRRGATNLRDVDARRDDGRRRAKEGRHLRRRRRRRRRRERQYERKKAKTNESATGRDSREAKRDERRRVSLRINPEEKGGRFFLSGRGQNHPTNQRLSVSPPPRRKTRGRTDTKKI